MNGSIFNCICPRCFLKKVFGAIFNNPLAVCVNTEVSLRPYKTHLSAQGQGAAEQLRSVSNSYCLAIRFETYQKIWDFYDRCIGCKKVEWIREGPDSMIEIARKCWLMKSVKIYPEICKYLINAGSTAGRRKLFPNFEMESLEMVPKGNAPDYCEVRVKIKKQVETFPINYPTS